jgi:hypothetical protein
MNLIITKEKLYQILFTLCVSVPYLNNYELTFLVWSGTVLITLQKSYSIEFVKQILLFGGIFFLAFFSSLFNEFKAYDFIRDITYLAKPILGLLIGYQLCKSKLKNPLQTVIYTGILLAVIHLCIVFYGVIFVGFRNIHQIRTYSGYFSDFEVYVIVLLLFHRDFNLEISPIQKKWFLVVLVLSSLFYLSRTNFIQFGILFLALKGFFVLNKRKLIALITVIFTGLILYSAIVYYNPRRNGKGIEAFMYKVKIAPTEPFKTKINTEDYKDFNDNYRSVENINTVKQMVNDGWFTVIFGKGLGSKVDLKKDVLLDSTKLRFIAVLHNGFMTVFLKSGILGVFLLFISIFLLFRKQKSEPLLINKVNYLFTGTAFFLFISYWVFMGFYFKADTKSILIGLLLAYAEKIKRENTTVLE